MTTSDSTPPDPTALAVDLRVAFGALRRALQRQASAGDLTPSQMAVVKRIDEHGPMTITALAREEGVRSQSMGATVGSLEALGYLTRQPDPSDGRQSIVSLTPEFARAFRDSRAARNDWLAAQLENTLNPAELQELAHALTLLRRITDR